ncbi:MAG: methionyl-tRNA formyltransferase [Bacteroidia bacterium]|nr:methionyl-tRNA formyltransferase [Bacteroidia bacterium]
MKIIFLGTPAFAVPSLDILVRNGYEIPAVVTATDKPAGRGQKNSFSEIKQYALSAGIPVLQPEKMSDPGFLERVRSLGADLQIVVAFRMMPERLWSMPALGTFNLHGSLLPQYRGAAPINRAIMNGETKTGVTTFFLKHEIDTGNIVFREEISIGPDETAGELHDRMMLTGAALVLKTVKAIETGNYPMHSQKEFMKPGEVLHTAPKIFKEDCRLDFQRKVHQLHNQVRGLSPYPGAFFNLRLPDQTDLQVKVLRSSYEEAGTVLSHEIISDGKTYLKISAADGFLHLLELQLPGKKRMKADELLRGFRFPPEAVIC